MTDDLLSLRLAKPSALCWQSAELELQGLRDSRLQVRLYHELANPSPGFLVIPILKGVVGPLLAFFGPAIQQLYNIIAGKTSEHARESNSRLPREGIEPASSIADGQNKDF